MNPQASLFKTRELLLQDPTPSVLIPLKDHSDTVLKPKVFSISKTTSARPRFTIFRQYQLFFPTSPLFFAYGRDRYSFLPLSTKIYSTLSPTLTLQSLFEFSLFSSKFDKEIACSFYYPFCSKKNVPRHPLNCLSQNLQSKACFHSIFSTFKAGLFASMHLRYQSLQQSSFFDKHCNSSSEYFANNPIVNRLSYGRPFTRRGRTITIYKRQLQMKGRYSQQAQHLH